MPGDDGASAQQREAGALMHRLAEMVGDGAPEWKCKTLHILEGILQDPKSLTILIRNIRLALKCRIPSLEITIEGRPCNAQFLRLKEPPK